jgi:hypothetical protein
MLINNFIEHFGITLHINEWDFNYIEVEEFIEMVNSSINNNAFSSYDCVVAPSWYALLL